MSILWTVDELRARGVELPADDDAAQDLIDGQEAWLARRIGSLVGERTQTFYVGWACTRGKLALARYTDDVELTDGQISGASTVDPDLFRLVDEGSAVHRVANVPPYWTGPYVTATYSPNDELEVREALAGLCALASTLPGPYQSEQIGAYSYQFGGGSGQPLGTHGQRAAIVSSLLPKRDPLATMSASRPVDDHDPVINRPEVVGW